MVMIVKNTSTLSGEFSAVVGIANREKVTTNTVKIKVRV